jgi:hypothetical protein
MRKGNTMNRKNKNVSLFVVVLAILGVAVLLATPALAGGRGDGPVVFVTSQGLYYDSIVTANPLPARGPFQVLEMDSNGLYTEFGPGDPEYVGGRWVEDFDGDGVYHYFSCPLLPPGRETP